MNLFQDFIKQKPNAVDGNARITALRTDQNGMPSPHQEPDMSVEDRYYKCSEYLALSNAKKLGLKRKREAHGHQPKSKTKSHNPRNPSPGHLKQLQSSIAKLTSTIMALQAEETPEPDTKRVRIDDKDKSNSNQTTGNLRNKALFRKNNE